MLKKLLVGLMLLTAGTAEGQGKLLALKYYVVVATRSSPPPSAPAGDQYLVGLAPSGPWANHEGEIAIAGNGGTWDFKSVPAPSQVYDFAAGAVYAKTDKSSSVNLWPGSYFVSLSPSFPKFRPTIPFTGNLTVGPGLSGAFLVASPDAPASLVLISPASNPAMIGGQVFLEKGNTLAGLTITVSGGGKLCDSSLENIAPLNLGPDDRRFLHLMAGGPSSTCAWYTLNP